MFVITKTNTNQNKAIMNLQDFTNQAEKLGYKRLSDTYETRLGEKIYGFTYEKSDYNIYHWFRESVSGTDTYMMFEHTYSTDTGRTSKRRNNQVWRLILGQ